MSTVIDTHIHPALFAPICADRERFAFRCEEMNYHLMSPVDLPLLQNLQELAEAGYQEYVTIEICQKAYWLEADRYAREAWELIWGALA